MALGYERGDTSVMCPYYVGKTEKTIICNGGLDPGGKTECKFRTKNKRREYMNRYCRSCFGACPLCRQNDSALNFERPPTA
jgi:hypothetical protein